MGNLENFLELNVAYVRMPVDAIKPGTRLRSSSD
jgi:hypothetical protein